MSNKAYNRGSNRISTGIVEDRKAKEAQWGRAVDRHTRALEIETAAQAIEIEHLTKELERARRAYKRRRAERDVAYEELEHQRSLAKSWKRLALQFLNALEITDIKHKKLSKIVRLAISPETYHIFHEIVEEDERVGL